jgi:hypothetical protein
MKIYYLSAVAICCFFSSYGQNTFPATGNVGIGTSDIVDNLTIGEYGGSITLRDRTTSVTGTSSLAKLKFYDICQGFLLQRR